MHYCSTLPLKYSPPYSDTSLPAFLKFIEAALKDISWNTLQLCCYGYLLGFCGSVTVAFQYLCFKLWK